MKGNNQTRNHKLVADAIVTKSNLVSRQRCRITTKCMRKVGFKPGERVNVQFDSYEGRSVIKVTQNPKGNYKIERDGSLRFSSNRYTVNRSHYIQAEKTEDCVVIY